MTTEPREPSRLPIRGTIATVGTLGALTLLLSFQGGPLAPADPTSALADEDRSPTESDTSSAVAQAQAPVEPQATEPGLAEDVLDGRTTEPVVGDARTVIGDAIAIRWGDVQVAVTVQGDDIIDVQALALPMGDRRSQRINAHAEPTLREEAIASDSAEVSVVSGATYTSEAYATSLQSALDQLGS